MFIILIQYLLVHISWIYYFVFFFITGLVDDSTMTTMIFQKPVNTRKVNVGEMLPETVNILTDFYEPFNEQLAELLGDRHFLYHLSWIIGDVRVFVTKILSECIDKDLVCLRAGVSLPFHLQTTDYVSIVVKYCAMKSSDMSPGFVLSITGLMLPKTYNRNLRRFDKQLYILSS